MYGTVIVGNSPLFNSSLKRIISTAMGKETEFYEFDNVRSVVKVQRNPVFFIVYGSVLETECVNICRSIYGSGETMFLAFSEVLGKQDKKLIKSSKIDFFIPMNAELDFVNKLISSLFRNGKNTKNKELLMSREYLSLFRADVRDLTEKERDVLRKICAGYTNSDISTELGIKECTVKATITRTRKKLRMTSRHQALSFVQDLNHADVS
ncbi:helix-turn-helix transcriptional regulator [Marinobacterium sp. D7]|uniref:helix-turn-helix transcriptional regulator n=1 Tax=Marinobacterium ramblicola TaxID=2849041 RepID=UPI001C2D306C|nr:helix-turn-helix transcriptional regulator [Marinobacterium ramblicola]MBV1789491.1 helix-turn-helix transcriptional regulator [Marinobacterium ramblicola]